MGEVQIGQDVVLKENEAQTQLLQLLPTKAQLGFSSLKEHFSQRGDSGVKRFLQSSKPHDPIKLEYTCIDVTEDFITLGCNFGILFFYDRKLGRLQRFISESKQVPIVCVKILASQNFVVTGQFNGALTIFNYAKEKDGNYKVLLKCTVDDHHHSPVTCVEWTPDGTKLFSGDSEGNVAISVINMDDGQTHTVFICNENSPVVQLSLCHAALVVSTLRRSLIWPFSLKTPVQVGQQERKIHGNFGACFFPKQQDHSNNGSPSIYAARPGLRIWRANMEGKVSTTMIFKDSIAKGEPEISTINLPSSCENGSQNEPKQFGPLVVYADDYLVSFQGSCLWVLDPNMGVVAGCHSNFGCIIDIATFNQELFVLTKGGENFVRRITFENRTQSPIIEVKTLSLQEDEMFKPNIPRTGSVNQFEENDKIDKLIGGVVSTTVGFISGVKRNVVKTIEQIKVRDDSDESSSSSGESPTSLNASSPITIIRRQPVVGSTSESETPSFVTSPCVVIPSPKQDEQMKQMNNVVENKPELDDKSRSENQAPNFQEPISNQDTVADRCGDMETNQINIIVKHDLREKLIPFHHISGKDFNSEIVFEGTSKRKPRKRRKINKDLKKLQDNESSDEERTHSDQNMTNGFIDGVEPLQVEECKQEENRPESIGFKDSMAVSENQKISNDLNVIDDLKDEFRERKVESPRLTKENIENEIVRQEILSTDLLLDEKKKIDEVHLPTEEFTLRPNDEAGDKANATPTKDSIDTGHCLTGSVQFDILKGSQAEQKGSQADQKRRQAEQKGSQAEQNVNQAEQKGNQAEQKGNQAEQNVNQAEQDDINLRACKNTNNTELDEMDPRLPKVSAESSDVTTENLSSLPTKTLLDGKDADTGNITGILGTKQDPPVQNESEDQDSNEKTITKPEDPLFDPSEVLNVEISAQEPLKNLQPSEPCRKVHGEALERTHVRNRSAGTFSVGQEDTIDSNVCWSDDEDEKIDFDDSPPHSPMSSEPSLFPAPQMNYHSIYSQDTVSLSEISFSEPEHDIPSYSKNTNERDGDFIDSLALLSIDSDEATDIEDNGCHSPPINLDQDGGVELTEATFLQHRFGVGSAKDSVKGSNCSSPSVFEIDTPLPLSPHSVAEKVSERLRLLADSWADIPVPNCGTIQSVTVTDTLIWCVDNHEHLFATASSSAVVVWKKVDGRARQLAANQHGTIIWSVNRKKVASYRTNVKASNPQGSDWETVENDVLEVAVDDTAVWGIRTNGDIFVRTGVSAQKPEGTGQRSIRTASDLVHITCVGSMVWGLDIYNHVQIYQGNLSCLAGNEQSIQWLELPGITASYVTLGPKGVCWIIDKDGKVWFNLEISEHNFFGGKWYQLSIGEYLVQDPTVLSTVISFFAGGNEPKVLSGNDISGIWILSKHGTLHAARGHLLGTRWELTVPIAMASSTFWTCVSAQGATGNGGFIWALQPNGDLHCFRPESKSFVVQPPPKTVLKFISASPRCLWALTNNQDVYIRRGISETAPQGLKWMIVDMKSMGSERICSIACGILVAWAVDFHGNVWFQMGKEDTRKTVYSPAWIQVEGSPFDGCRFIKVAIGSNDCTVWAVDDRNNVYARRDVTESFLIGTSWEVVAGTGARDITISDSLVWALCPSGNIVCRFGISPVNFVGDYWKTVPGCFEHISVSADDELWGIDRQGQLYKRDTVHFFGTQSTRKVPSYSQLFPTDDDWELI